MHSLRFPGDSGHFGFKKVASGQSRPIPEADKNTLETQLAHHQQLEQHKARVSHQRQDLLNADPWEISHAITTGPVAMLQKPHLLPGTDSTCPDSTEEEHFYSLDLTSSLTSSVLSNEPAAMDVSTMPTSPTPVEKGAWFGGRMGTVHRRFLEGEESGEAIPLHEGVGLQQLSQSPPDGPSSHQPYPSTRQPSFPITPQQRCPPSYKYSLTLSGMTLSLLEADPPHTYTTRLKSEDSLPGPGSTGPGTGTGSGPSTGPDTGAGLGANSGSSIDDGGLDTVKYFELVSELLKSGVNHHQLELQHQELAQVLPADHLM